MKVIGKLKGIWGIISDPYHFYHLPLYYNVMKRFEEGNGNPLQYSCLENPLDRGAQWATVHGVAELDTTEQPTQWNSCHAQKEFPHRFTGEIFHDASCEGLKFSTANMNNFWNRPMHACIFINSYIFIKLMKVKIPWRRAWQPTPAFLPGESHGQRSLADYSPWGRKEVDTTEWLTHTHTLLSFVKKKKKVNLAL